LAAWAWVIVGVAGFVALSAWILYLPLHIELIVDTAAARRFQGRVEGLFGLVKYTINPLTKNKPRPEKRTPGKVSVKTMLRVLGTKELLPAVSRLFRSIFRQTRMEGTNLKLKIGFDDPADGGMAYAAAGILNHLWLPGRFKLEIEPEISDHIAFRCYLHTKVRVRPIKLIIPLCRFVFSKPVFRAWREWMTA